MGTNGAPLAMTSLPHQTFWLLLLKLGQWQFRQKILSLQSMPTWTQLQVERQRSFQRSWGATRTELHLRKILTSTSISVAVQQGNAVSVQGSLGGQSWGLEN